VSFNRGNKNQLWLGEIFSKGQRYSQQKSILRLCLFENQSSSFEIFASDRSCGINSRNADKGRILQEQNVPRLELFLLVWQEK
jgi:hypothetical protein